MTYLEKLKQEHPEIPEENIEQIIDADCPDDWGYEERSECTHCDLDKPCTKCWNREMPSEARQAEPSCDDVRKAYKQGMNDAWELMCKINKLSPEESEKVYGERFQYITDIIENLTPQEALAKMKIYEEQKIEVGDMVAWTDSADNKFNGVVLDFKYNTDNEVVVFDENGCVDVWKIAECKKTGKHIDIQSIFEQIGGE